MCTPPIPTCRGSLFSDEKIEQLRSSYDNLTRVYERLRHGSFWDASRLLEQIRSKHVISIPLEDSYALRRSMDDLNPHLDYRVETGGEQAQARAESRASTGLSILPLSIATTSRQTQPMDLIGLCS